MWLLLWCSAAPGYQSRVSHLSSVPVHTLWHHGDLEREKKVGTNVEEKIDRTPKDYCSWVLHTEISLSLSLSLSLLLTLTPTREPHDKLHPSADIDSPESINDKGEREDVGRPTNQYQDQAPYDQTKAEWRWDGEHLHTNVQKHNSLCRGKNT